MYKFGTVALIVSKTNKASQDVMVAFSVFRFNKIATLSKKLVFGELGHISKAQAAAMKLSFNSTFGF